MELDGAVERRLFFCRMLGRSDGAGTVAKHLVEGNIAEYDTLLDRIDEEGRKLKVRGIGSAEVRRDTEGRPDCEKLGATGAPAAFGLSSCLLECPAITGIRGGVAVCPAIPDIRVPVAASIVICMPINHRQHKGVSFFFVVIALILNALEEYLLTGIMETWGSHVTWAGRRLPCAEPSTSIGDSIHKIPRTVTDEIQTSQES